jgi:ABC-type polysaccharide/polyol phosphate transport system ATPase subunit
MAKVELRNVWERFSMEHEASTLKKQFVLYFKRKERIREEIWALRDVSFKVENGDCIGIVGENASGKTTLLKIIGGIIKPTKGEVIVEGKVASLLALGLGFNPELTARENVYLYASIMGMDKEDIDWRYKEIVKFSELEHFMDTKLMNFSDGMKVRLGFATAINVDADILLVDEVLAVGDGAFQKKCLEKFEELKHQGKIIIFVSHGLGVVKEYADNAIFLRKGRIEAIGEPSEVVEKYSISLKNKELSTHNSRVVENLREVGIERINLLNEKGETSWVFETGENFRAKIKFDSLPHEIPFYIEFLGRSMVRFYTNKLKNKEVFFNLDSLPLSVGEYKLVVNTRKGISEPLEIFVVDSKKSNSIKAFSPEFSLNDFFAFGNGCEKVIEDLRKGNTIVFFSDFNEAIRDCENGAVFKNGKLLLTGEIEKITDVYKEMIVEKYEKKLGIMRE